MATQVQNRRGTTAEHSTFTGANGELTVDTTKRTLVVHDGATAGGRPLLREDQSNLPTSAPTTGIYNASGSLAISTGGTGRLFVDASGNVGVGTSSPLNVGNYNTIHLAGRNATTGGIFRSTSSDNSIIGLFFTDSNGVYTGTDTNHPYRIATNGSERLRITAAGLVGIGSSTPVYQAHIFGAGVADADSKGVVFGLYNSSAAAAGLGSSIAFGANISTTGTSPVYNLASIEGIKENGTDGNFASALKFVTRAHTGSPTERVRIDSSGRVGIGSTNPGAFSIYNNLVVENSSNPGITLSNSSGAGTAGIHFAATSTFQGKAEIACDITTGALFAKVAGTERCRVDNSGRLLVGTSSGSGNIMLHVVKGGTVNTRVESSSFADTNVCSLSALAGGRLAEIGVYKHSGITNAGTFIRLDEEDGTLSFLWVDNSGNLRIGSDVNFVGTTSGTVVGTQTSDERIKNILGPVEYGLETIKQIEPVRYTLKTEPNAEKLGFIAQQVQPLIPQSVFDTNEHIEGEPEDAPTKLGMEYVALIPVLVNAIKELSAEVDSLKAQLS